MSVAVVVAARVAHGMSVAVVVAVRVAHGMSVAVVVAVRVAHGMSVAVVVAVRVAVPPAGELEPEKPGPGRDQETSDERVLDVLDGRAQLQTDDHEDPTEQQRDRDVGDSGQGRERGHAAQRIALRAAEDGQWHPVVGEDGVAEADARSRQERSETVHTRRLNSYKVCNRCFLSSRIAGTLSVRLEDEEER
jgi:hypothetical protein